MKNKLKIKTKTGRVLKELFHIIIELITVGTLMTIACHLEPQKKHDANNIAKRSIQNGN